MDKEQVKKVDSEEKKKKKRRRIVTIIIAIIVIIILLLLRCCTNTNNTEGNTEGKPGFSTEVDANATDTTDGKSTAEITEELNNKVDEGMINISMNLSPVFKTGSSEGNLMILNDTVNTLPQVIEIYIKDTDTLIYTSKLIPIGKTVEKAKLDVVLQKGVYECIAYFNAVNPETGESNGKAGAEIKVEILN